MKRDCIALGRASRLVGSALLCALPASAAEFTETYYIQVTFNHMGPTTAYMFDSGFNQLPNASWSTLASAVKFAADDPHFLRGADYEMVTRDSSGNVTVVTGIPTFSEANHHFLVWANGLPVPYDVPLAAGSELTDFVLPPGYGVPLHGTEVGPVTWHWHNATGVGNISNVVPSAPGDMELYVRMVLTFEDDLGTALALPRWYADFGICVPANATSAPYTTLAAEVLPGQASRVLVAVPHVHDHVEQVELRLQPAAGGDVPLQTFTPDNSRSHPVEHDDCGGAGAPVTWHVHGDGDGHLPAGGLQAHVWAPPGGYLLQPGDKLYASGSFNNPHTQAIDNMLVYMVFFALP